MLKRTHKLPTDPHAGLRGRAKELAEQGITLREQIKQSVPTPTQEGPMATSTTKQSEKTNTGIGVRDVATELNADPRELRAFMRAMDVRAGRGKRYSWPSLKNQQVQRIMRAYRKQHEATPAA